MAGDWIKWTKGLARKPEVMQMAIRLGKSRHEVAGLLMEVWEWADENVVSDIKDVSGTKPDTCPGVVQFDGPPEQLIIALTGVSGLADAMVSVGWLCQRSGHLAFPNFSRHNGKSAKSRALDSLRKHNSRTGAPPSVPPPVRDVSGSQPDKSATREEEIKKNAGDSRTAGKTKTKPKKPQSLDELRELGLV